MKRGVRFECGHAIDEVGTPFPDCLDCQAKVRTAIDLWNAKERVNEKLKNGLVPF